MQAGGHTLPLGQDRATELECEGLQGVSFAKETPRKSSDPTATGSSHESG